MKKLMIIVAVACAALASQAASFNWKTGAANQVYVMNTTDKLVSGTAYLFDTGVVTQQMVIDAFSAGTDISSLSGLDNSSVSAGVVAAKTGSGMFDWGDPGDTLNAYFAVLANVGGQDYLYLSTTAQGGALESGFTTIQFKEKETSQLAAMGASAGYQGAGWYTAAVPEPTSGLLLLLGMAGLALKRKQA